MNDNRSVSDGGGITRFYYDRVSRVSEVNDIYGKAVRYEYNNKGLRSGMVYPDNTSIYYYYDALGRLTKITGSGGTVAEYQYDGLSRKVFASYGNGSYIDYRYDILDKIRDVNNNFGTNGSIVFQYTDYDKVGNRRNMIVDGNTHTYDYDKLYQLINVDYPGGSGLSIGYDKLGNRTSTTNGSTIPYVSNNLNQYTLIDSEAFYNYDDNGNLTTDRDRGYYYDCENRLTQVAGSGWDVYYKYDYLGRLVKRTQGGTTSKYVYDGDQIIAEYDGSNNLVRKFVYGAGIDEPVIMINVDGQNETKYYYHYDGLGSVIALSDSSKTIVEKYSYDVFGTPTIRDAQNAVLSTSAFGNSYMFTGRQYDAQAQVYYYRARFYSPALGRFLQPDPIGYEAGINLYTYVGNNPVNFIDPLGLWYVDINWSFGLGIGITGGIQMGPQGTSSYFGGGFMTPPGGVSVYYSPNNISPGWNVGAGGGSLVGGQGGYGFGQGGGWYGEGGATTPGASATLVYVRQPKPPKPPKPSDKGKCDNSDTDLWDD